MADSLGVDVPVEEQQAVPPAPAHTKMVRRPEESEKPPVAEVPSEPDPSANPSVRVGFTSWFMEREETTVVDFSEASPIRDAEREVEARLGFRPADDATDEFEDDDRDTEVDDLLIDADTDDDDDPEQPKKRRRRRRRRRRRSSGEREGDDAEAVVEADVEIEHPADSDHTIESFEMDQDDATDEESDEEEAADEKPRRRRRRRRRGSKTAADEERRTSSSKSERRSKPDDEEAEQFVDEDDEEDDDDDDDAKRSKAHRAIPSWQDAIGFIVDTNMEARSKSPAPKESRRGGRGRSRGGRSSGSRNGRD